MILREAQVRRKGHGKCGLLLNRNLSNNRAKLPSSDVLAHTEASLHNVWSPVVNSEQGAQDQYGRKPFYMTRARCQDVHRPAA